MATTTAAAGKLELAARQGKSIPAGWALNEKAESTDDPRIAQKARKLLPLGGSREGGNHKGYGLAILVEILCGVLSGTVTALNANQDPRGHFFGAIRVDAFRPADEFKRDMDRLIFELRSTPPLDGQERVYVAGKSSLKPPKRERQKGFRYSVRFSKVCKTWANNSACRTIWNKQRPGFCDTVAQADVPMLAVT